MNGNAAIIEDTNARRIGFLGAHRTGKSTLSEVLSRAVNLDLVATTASAEFKRLGVDPANVQSFHDRCRVQDVLFDALDRQWATGGAAFVTDRTPLDMAAYLLIDAERFSPLSPAQEAFRDQYIDRCLRLASQRFDELVLVQPGITLVAEPGKAKADANLIESLNDALLALLDRAVEYFNPNALHVLPRDIIELDERVTWCVEALNLN